MLPHSSTRKLQDASCRMGNSQIIKFKLLQSTIYGLWDEKLTNYKLQIPAIRIPQLRDAACRMKQILTKDSIPQLAKSTQIMHKFQKFN